MEEYLPPVVTRLKADLSDLMEGLARARIAMVAWAIGVRDDVDAVMRNAGRDWGIALGESFQEEADRGLQNFDRHVERDFVPRAAQNFAKAGSSAGQGFFKTLMSVGWPILIGLLIAALPSLTTMVAAAISLGIGFGFIGLGAFLLREQPGLIAAATRLRDTAGAVFKEAALPMLAPMMKGLDILTAGVKELGPSFKEIFAAIGPSIPDLATGIVGFVREMLPGLKALAPVIGQLISAFGAALPVIGKGLGDFFTSLAESGPAMIAFIQDAGIMFGKLLTIIGGVIKVLSDVYLWVKNVRDLAVAGGWDTPWHAWANILGTIWNWIKKVAGAVGEWFSGLLSDAEGVGTSLGSKIKGWIDAVVGFGERLGQRAKDIFNFLLAGVKALPGLILQTLQALPGALGDLAMRAFDGLMYWSGFAVATVLRIIRDLPGQMRDLTARAWAFVTESFARGVQVTIAEVSTWPERIWNFFVDLRNRVVATVVQLWTDVTDWVSRLYHSVINWVARTALEVVAWWEALPGRVVKAVNDLVHAVTGAVRGLLDKAKELFNSAKSWAAQAGKDLIAGFIDGIRGAIDGAVDIVRRGMDRIRRGAKDALGISSPSKVFAELGRNTMDGYVQGLTAREGVVRGALRALVAPVPGPALAALAAGTGARGASGGQGDGTTMVATTINIDGQRVITALTPAAQQRKLRTGTTGLA